MPPQPPTGKRAAMVVMGVGAALLLVTLFLGWYSMSLGSGASVARETFYPAATQLWGSQGGSSYSNLTSYSTVFMGETGMLYLVVTGLIVVGALMGFLTVYLIRSGIGRKHRRLVPSLAVLVVALALAGPMLVAVAQPATLCSEGAPTSTPFFAGPSNDSTGTSPDCGWEIVSPDNGGYAFASGIGPGPQSSFFGTQNVSGQPLTWGPSDGWYVSVLASVTLLVGVFFLFRGARGPEVAAKPSAGGPTTDEPNPDTGSRASSPPGALAR
jgi:hypothetical protein